MGETYDPLPDEYVRPPGRYLIPDPRNDERFDNHFVRGSQFNPKGFVGLEAGQEVEVEMVREPGNPHHAEAMALLVGGVRIGYVGAGIAEEWQCYVIKKNEAGQGVFAHGLIENVEQPRVTIFLPWMSTLRRERAARQWEETQRLRAKQRAEAYRLRTEGKLTFGLIAAELDCSTGLASKLYREYMEGMTEAEKAAAEAERVAAEEDLRMMVLEEHERTGQSVGAIAAKIGHPVSKVREVLRAAGAPPQNTYNDAVRNDRVARCRLVGRMQAAGRTRKEIASALGVTWEVVKILLKDGKFYDAPPSDPVRLELVRKARLPELDGLGLAEAAEELGVSAVKLKAARRDRAVLQDRYGEGFVAGEED
ncbi:hypothetical protein ART_2012 [Arthrobacter sp. PAMC 25486]|uniref:hypothetical protein n=1 Tax=Arthrobacter sp. PAMC 25486 TaxID=1494608 RepID=UPI000535B319|nr:hypothetical protein [Arthrobacter sp. PAMC 25486]AIY01611.1 hypothetical protein ART_2012 [Arthrobacter sp. PAMC 25486]